MSKKYSYCRIAGTLHILLLAVITFLYSPAWAQSFVSSAGSNAEGAGGYVSYSVGEVFYGYISGAGGSLTLGAQQSWLITVETDVPPTSGYTPAIRLFPNPTTGKVFVRYDGAAGQNSRFVLSNPQGIVIQSGELEGQVGMLDVSLLNGTVFFLSVYWSDKSIRTFKLIKK